MCLDTVDKKPTVTEGEGWKVFSHTRDGHLSQWLSMGTRVRTSTWVKDPAIDDIKYTDRITRNAETYPCGFHLFRTLGDAAAWDRYASHRRVSFRNVAATGQQRRFNGKFLRTIVAREIYIHPKGK